MSPVFVLGLCIKHDAHKLCAYKKRTGYRMQTTFNSAAPKKPANVSINSDLLAQARACKINLSATLEQALTEKLAQVQREQWLRDNQQAIAGYNQLVDEQGVFSDGLRSF